MSIAADKVYTSWLMRGKGLTASQAEAVVNHSRELRAANDRLRLALQTLYDETADYITVNHLGDVHHNLSMQIAHDTLRSASHPSP